VLIGSLSEVPLVPEVRLHQVEDVTALWEALEERTGRVQPPPFWAAAWPGGQALARYVLDHPEVVAGRRVLDLAAGSGLVAVAAALAGAAAVTANDIDPWSLEAVSRNAGANGVTVAVRDGDLLDGDGGDADVVLAGDVFYSRDMSARMHAFMTRARARGAEVYVGDPGRAFLPPELVEVASYPGEDLGTAQDPRVDRARVLRLPS
jgi:predicted nicotinamide N-methyase